MRRRSDSLSEAIGTDAFLDIVANLVGILLILIMVIGVRMEDATQTSKAVVAGPVSSQRPAPLEFPEVAVPDATEAKLAMTRLQTSIREANAQAQQITQLMRFQKLDRDNLMLAIAQANRELERRRADLNESQREQVALDLERQQTIDEFDRIAAQLKFLKLAAQEDNAEVVEHIATPLAKTVFIREEHFRLQNGRVLYVPLSEMTRQLRTEAPKKMWKLKTASQTTETIGPQHGFEMRYTLRRNRVPFKTDSGINAVREVVELDRFVMVPVGAATGEPMSEAISETSTFRTRLNAWSPRETIITVWTYPDSFAEFRQLKEHLYGLGYLTAARPLPANQLISGSPQGTRSAAQ